MKEKLSNEQQLTSALIGTATHLGPWAVCSSPSRLVMLASQIQQKLITKGINRPRFFTGVEKEYAKYAFGCRADNPYEVIAVVDKFETGRGASSFRYNPKRIIIVKNILTGVYDYLEYDTYCSHHTSFGFEFQPVIENAKYIQPGEIIQRDTELTRSPGVMPEGDYVFTTRTKSVFLSHHSVTEDGFGVSKEWCEENRTTGYGEVIIIVPKGKYPTNTYGDSKRYQPLPLPGERIRKDGLLMSLREYDDILGAVEMTDDAMSTYDYYFDEKYFIEAGVDNARVVDIELWNSDGDKLDQAPLFMGKQDGEDDALERLWKAKIKFHQNIVSAHKSIRSLLPKGKEPKMTKKLHRLVTDSMVYLNAPEGKRKYRFKKQSIPTLYIKINFMYDITPTIGYKLTNLYGMKGVICMVKPRAEMPRYADGTTADFIGDGFSIINRMNPSVFFEHYCNYIAEQRVEKPIRERLAKSKTKDDYEWCWELLQRFYRPAVPMYLDKINSQNWNFNRIRAHVDKVAESTVHAWMPPKTPGLGIKQIQSIRNAFPEEPEHVTWINDLGNQVTSNKPVIIGEMCLMVLEKTGHDWGAVDVAKRQVHGVPTKPSGRDRYNLPFRKIPFRLFGESEIRNYAGIIGGHWAADMLDRANNPRAQEYIWKQVIETEHPTNLEHSVDRIKIPLGEGMALSYLNNALYCAGAEMQFIDVDNLTDAEEIAILDTVRPIAGYKDYFADQDPGGAENLSDEEAEEMIDIDDSEED